MHTSTKLEVKSNYYIMNLFPYTIFLINQLSIYNNQATLKIQGRLIINKVARKPCSVLDNHLSGIRIAPNL